MDELELVDVRINKNYPIDRNHISEIEDLEGLIKYFKENIILEVSIKNLLLDSENVYYTYYYDFSSSYLSDIDGRDDLSDDMAFQDVCEKYCDDMEEWLFDLGLDYWVEDEETSVIIGTYEDIKLFLKYQYQSFPEWLDEKRPSTSTWENVMKGLDNYIISLYEG